MAWKSRVCFCARVHLSLSFALIFTCPVRAWPAFISTMSVCVCVCVCVCVHEVAGLGGYWVSLMTHSMVIRHKCSGRNGWSDRGEGVCVCVIVREEGREVAKCVFGGRWEWRRRDVNPWLMQHCPCMFQRGERTEVSLTALAFCLCSWRSLLCPCTDAPLPFRLLNRHFRHFSLDAHQPAVFQLL